MTNQVEALHQLPGYRSHIPLWNVAEVWCREGRHWDSATGKAALIEEQPSSVAPSRLLAAICRAVGLPEPQVQPQPVFREPDPLEGDPWPCSPAVLVRFSGAERATEFTYATDAAAQAACDGLLAALRAFGAQLLARP
ncbi:hypothetical protein [Azospirillum tabaci]|uniref:hypothetical protein n=1 Tax=Azospirillum tabaci TaxID=2752310 RepID=UPI001660F998|nr:hypothetical protein [Azospirillum tabaci]